jgi:hypothetical protein
MSSYLDAAIAELGLTDNPQESGFLLPDGSFLKMGEYGNRGLDHRVVGGFVRGEFEYRSDAMYQWMLVTGSIRWTPERNAVELVTEPTTDQIDTLENLVFHLGQLDFEVTRKLRGQWRSVDTGILVPDDAREILRSRGRGP